MILLGFNQTRKSFQSKQVCLKEKRAKLKESHKKRENVTAV